MSKHSSVRLMPIHADIFVCRQVFKYDLTWEEAEEMLHHTIAGQMMLLHDSVIRFIRRLLS
jgi:hypothetical protein